MDENLGLLLKLILDKAGQEAVKKGLDETATSIDGVIKTVTELTAKEKELKAAIQAQEERVKNAKTGIDAYANSLEKAKKQLEAYQKTGAASNAGYAQQSIDKNLASIEKYSKKLKDESKILESMQAEIELTQRLKQEVKDLAKFTGLSEKELAGLSAEQVKVAKTALAAQKQINVFNDELSQTERRVADLRQTAESISRISTGLFYTGSAIVGSIFLAANEEAQRIKEAEGVVDETTQKWLTAQERIQRSYQRIGKTALTTVLPMLEKIAAIAEKGSKFVEQHPDLVKAAFNTGAIIATIGAVGILVAKGVRFVADITLITAQLKYATSTAMFKSSVDRFLAGVTGQKLTSAGGTGSAIGSTLGTVTLMATSVIIGAEVGLALGNAISKALYGKDYKKQDFGDIASTYYKYATIPGIALAQQLNEVGALSDESAHKIAKFTTGVADWLSSTGKAENALDGLTDGLDDLSASTEAAKDELEAIDIMGKLEKENLEAERKYNDARAEIIQDSSESISKATEKLAEASNRIKTTLISNLSKIDTNFATANKKAETDYQQSRAEIIRDSNEEILQIQRDAKEELRKLEEDFTLQSEELVNARDALGLVKAQREFERNKKEIEQNSEKEIAERKRQTQIQISDLRRNFLADRAERLAKYRQDILDAKAQAAQELLDAQKAHAQKLQEIARQRAAELSELQRSYNEERRNRIIAAYNAIKDLSNAQNAERIMRQRYYSVILADATTFMSKYATALQPRTGSGTLTVPTRHSGGYTDDGLYRMKRREFVLSPSSTAAAESLIGSNLSQQILLSALAGGGNRSLTLNDSRRFDSSLPLAERRAIEQEATNVAIEKFALLMKGSR